MTNDMFSTITSDQLSRVSGGGQPGHHNNHNNSHHNNNHNNQRNNYQRPVIIQRPAQPVAPSVAAAPLGVATQPTIVYGPCNYDAAGNLVCFTRR